MATSNVDLFFEANTKVLTSILQMPDDLLAIMNPLTAALMWFVLLIQWAISVFGDLIRFKQHDFLRFQFLEVFQLYGFFMFFTLFLRGFHVITFPFYPQKGSCSSTRPRKRCNKRRQKTNLCIWFSPEWWGKNAWEKHGKTQYHKFSPRMPFVISKLGEKLSK